jgi:hypothetical protein
MKDSVLIWTRAYQQKYFHRQRIHDELTWFRQRPVISQGAGIAHRNASTKIETTAQTTMTPIKPKADQNTYPFVIKFLKRRAIEILLSASTTMIRICAAYVYYRPNMRSLRRDENL